MGPRPVACIYKVPEDHVLKGVQLVLVYQQRKGSKFWFFRVFENKIKDKKNHVKATSKGDKEIV